MTIASSCQRNLSGNLKLTQGIRLSSYLLDSDRDSNCLGQSKGGAQGQVCEKYQGSFSMPVELLTILVSPRKPRW